MALLDSVVVTVVVPNPFPDVIIKNNLEASRSSASSISRYVFENPLCFYRVRDAPFWANF